jgi:MFS family permease
VFYGWKIVGVTFLTNFISVGFVFYSYGVFFKALASDFGGSRLGVALGLTVMNVVAGALSPFIGRALDRGSIRSIMCLGTLLLSAGFLLVSRITALWQFYVLLGSLLAAGTMMMGGLATSTLVARWFVDRRGTALGLAGMGISLSGMVMAPVATQLISGVGWRNAFLVYAAVTVVVGLPAIWAFVLNRPEDVGLAPDGRVVRPVGAHSNSRRPPSPGDQPAESGAGHEWSTRSALAGANFWIIAAVIALNFTSMGAVLTHIVPHATDIGFAPLQAAFVLSCIAGLGVVGKALFGWIADRIEKRRAVWIACGFQALGIFGILNVRSYPLLLLAGGIFGLGMGGIVPLWGALIGAGFGRHAFGRVMGLMSPFMLPIQSLGVPFAGYIFDRTGSYNAAFQTFLGIYALAALVLVFLRLPQAEPGSDDLTGLEEESKVAVIGSARQSGG